MTKVPTYNIAQLRFIRLNLNKLTLEEIAAECMISTDEVKKIIVKKKYGTFQDYSDKFSIARFKEFIANKGKKPKPVPEPATTIVRPPAIYSNTAWDEYQDNLLKSK